MTGMEGTASVSNFPEVTMLIKQECDDAENLSPSSLNEMPGHVSIDFHENDLKPEEESSDATEDITVKAEVMSDDSEINVANVNATDFRPYNVKNDMDASASHAVDRSERSKKISSGKSFECKQCGESFKFKCQLERHLSKHSSGKPHKCCICGQRFREKYCNRHVKSHSEFHQCSDCGKILASKTRLLIHLKSHTRENLHKCAVCGKGFGDAGSMNRHVKTHSEFFPCNHCGERLKSKRTLMMHLRIHSGEKSHACSQCGKRFGEKRNMEKHVKTHDSGLFDCHECEKSFKWKNSLAIHLMLHAGLKPFECSVCGKRSHSQQYINIHAKTHTDQKEHFNCNECDKSFKLKDRLLIHLRTHSEEKPYGCPKCGKRFAGKQYMKQHIDRTHSGRKDFHCDECGKSFRENYLLARHSKIHSREKSFECSICGKKFRDKQYLQEHVETHSRLQ